MKRMKGDGSGVSHNPLMSPDAETGLSIAQGAKQATSAAFQESARIARESGRWDPAERRRGAVGSIGLKTLIMINFLLLGGFILFITGLVFFFNPTNDAWIGVDLLAVSAIMLLPGIWGAINWYGTSRGWIGFSYTSFNLD
jgi:hypothetical protein